MENQALSSRNNWTIWDAHVHVYPPDTAARREHYVERDRWFSLLNGDAKSKLYGVEELVTAMDRDQIDVSFICGFAFKDQGLCREMNDYVADSVRRYPGRLKGMGVISPMQRGAEAEISRCCDLGFVGIGELFPDGQGFSIDDSLQTTPLVKALDERGMFLMLHTAEQVGHKYSGKGNVGPEQAAAFAMNHPECRVIFAHMGGGLFIYEAMPEMRLALSNVRYDTAALPFLYGAEIIKTFDALEIAHKLIFGSDFPLLEWKRYEAIFDEGCKSTEMLKYFLSENMRNFVSN